MAEAMVDAVDTKIQARSGKEGDEMWSFLGDLREPLRDLEGEYVLAGTYALDVLTSSHRFVKIGKLGPDKSVEQVYTVERKALEAAGLSLKR